MCETRPREGVGGLGARVHTHRNQRHTQHRQAAARLRVSLTAGSVSCGAGFAWPSIKHSLGHWNTDSVRHACPCVMVHVSWRYSLLGVSWLEYTEVDCNCRTRGEHSSTEVTWCDKSALVLLRMDATLLCAPAYFTTPRCASAESSTPLSTSAHALSQPCLPPCWLTTLAPRGRSRHYHHAD